MEVADFKEKDSASYDSITGAFDRFTDRFTGPIATRVVELAELGPNDQVLDVGSGTGIIVFTAMNRLQAAGRLTGIDLSDGMLRMACDKAKRMGCGRRVSFLKMDAEALTFPDRSFDRVLSLYALRHFPRPEVALVQMRRVLRPGGCAVVAVGSAPPLLSFAGAGAVFRRFTGIARRAFGKGDLLACEYLDRLVERYLPAAYSNEEAGWTQRHAASHSVPRMMQDAGFRNIRTAWAGNDGIIASMDEFWEVQVTFSSLARKRIAAASTQAVEALRREFAAGCERTLAAGGRLRYPTGALIVAGTAPEHGR